MSTPDEAPLQGDEGAPDAWLVLDPAVIEGLRGLEPGIDILVLTWLDRASRDVLTVHPRGDSGRVDRTPVLDVKPVLRTLGER